MKIPAITLVLIYWFTLAVNAQPFTEVTVQSGINLSHSNSADRPSEPTVIGAGGAVADYDFDGYPDFYLLGGSDQHNALFKNQGNGLFIDVAGAAQVDLFDILGSGPVFADVDGDFDLDLLVFSINKEGESPNTGDSLVNRPRLFINLGNGAFMESMNAGFNSGMASYTGTFGDLDKDGDLDLFMSHWSADQTTSKQLFWENQGNGQFTDVTIDYLGFTQNANFDRWTFTANLTDINGDGWLDVLLASDFNTSRILYSTGFAQNQPAYLVTQPAFITDENGMGSAVADYDNDGDMDWFVTSIWDPDGEAEANWGVSGNRLYRNIGMGEFEDATDEAGLRQGFWGWGACFADFNNDGHLDIYHENGFTTPVFAEEFHNDPARLFMANGDGSFTESAVINGLNHTGQGRGISCVDYDLDGDLDILVMPNNAPYRLYQNQSSNSHHYLGIKLFDTGTNPYAYHAKIALSTAASTQTRELTGGNNYASNNPLTQHFGLGSETTISDIQITWPDGTQQSITNHIAIDQITSISRYCHTKFMTVINDENQGSAGIDIFIQNLNGSPLADQNVSMQIMQGPNAGQSANLTTDLNGQATFPLSFTSTGTDRIKFDFSVAGSPQLCRALVEWDIDLIFKHAFDS